MKAVLVVSFGTTHEDTRIKTIEAIENDIRAVIGENKLYRAWTSKIIMKRLRERNELFVDDIKAAMTRIHADGIKEVIVQPTHIINGVENDNMIRDVLEFKDLFEKISFGKPLLTDDIDYENIVEIVSKDIFDDINLLKDIDLAQENNTALILMGHGTDHYINVAYAALDYRFKAMNFENVYVAAVEGYPYIETVLKQIKNKNFKKIVLMPLMIVAGEHAKEDMAGEEEDSWKSLFEKEGYEVYTILKGLGEYRSIRERFIKSVEERF